MKKTPISKKKTPQAKVASKSLQDPHHQKSTNDQKTKPEYASTSTKTTNTTINTKIPEDKASKIIVQEHKSEEIKFLAGPSSIERVEDEEVSARNSGEIGSSTVDIEADRADRTQNENAPSSFLIFPLPQNSEDVKNENHLRLARIFDTSIWELSTDESRHVPETIHNLTAETGSPSASVLNLRTCSNHNLINDESNLHPFPTTETSLVSNVIQMSNTTATTTTTTTITTKITENEDANCGMNQETSTVELDEGRRNVHVLAVWPTQNGDFDLLTKLDDECATNDFCPSHEISDIFNPTEWFRDDLGDDDIPLGRQLKTQPGKFCLISPLTGESNISQEFEIESTK